MTTDTLHDYDRLVDTGFSDDQARALVELLATSSQPNPDTSRTLALILTRLDEMNERMDGLNKRMDRLEKRVGEVESRLYILDERMQSESRVQRMLNTTLIAIGALLGSLLAVFA